MAEGRRQIILSALCSLPSALCPLPSALCLLGRRSLPSMASKKKWLGLAALGAFLVAMFKRKKKDREDFGEPVEGTIET